MTDTCASCQFSLSNGVNLECHYNPPPWASVRPRDWCRVWELWKPEPPPSPFPLHRGFLRERHPPELRKYKGKGEWSE